MMRLHTLIVKSDGSPTPFVPPPEGEVWNLRRAALGERDSATAYAQLSLKKSGDESPWIELGTMRASGVDYMPLELPLCEYVEFRVTGSSSVHLIGTLESEFGLEEDSAEEDAAAEAQQELMEEAMLNGGRGVRGLVQFMDDSSDEDTSEDSGEEAPEGVFIEEITPEESAPHPKEKTTSSTKGSPGKAQKGVSPLKMVNTSGEKTKSDASKAKQESAVKSPERSSKAKQESVVKSPEGSFKARQTGAVKSPEGSSKAKQTGAMKSPEVSPSSKAKVKGGSPSDPETTTKSESKKLKRKKKKEGAGVLVASEEYEPQQKQPKVESVSLPEASTSEKKKKKHEDTKASAVSAAAKKRIRRFSNGYVIENLEYGPEEGTTVSGGSKVSIKYEGRLKDGTVFDETRGTKYFTFEYGKGEVIKGLDRGLDDMRVGDKRRLTVPSRMGYASKGAPPAIPPDADLSFDVEVMEIE